MKTYLNFLAPLQWMLLTCFAFCVNTAISQEQYKPEIKKRTKQTYKVEGENGIVKVDVSNVDGAIIMGGDIVLKPANVFEAIGVRKFLRWDDGVIPYKIAPNHPHKALILQAINTLNSSTVLWYREATSPGEGYVNIIYGSGCYSGLGKVKFGDALELSIGETCTSPGTIIHELLHAAGLLHEHQRFDRDEHIKILWDNIRAGEKHNFSKPLKLWAKDIGHYNYASVMHYGCYAYRKKQGMKTILSLVHPIGQRTGLSPGDVEAIKKMYYDIPSSRNKPNFPAQQLPSLLFTDCVPPAWPPTGPNTCANLKEQLNLLNEQLAETTNSSDRKDLLMMIAEVLRQKKMRNCE